MPLAVLAILIASGVALFEQNIKRLLAYSSIAQIGYILLGASFVTLAGLTASTVHLFNHALAKGALFLAVGCLATQSAGLRLSDLGGIAKRMPWTSAAFIVAGFSLIGIPGTAGFISKWYLITAALERVAGDRIGCGTRYQLADGGRLYLAHRRGNLFAEPAADQSAIREAPRLMLADHLGRCTGKPVLWAGSGSTRNARFVGGGHAAGAPAMSGSDLILLALALPLLGAVGIAAASRIGPNIREAATMFTAAALAWTVWSLVPELMQGGRPALTLADSRARHRHRFSGRAARHAVRGAGIQPVDR